ncbi:smoothelin-like protein 1 isoform X5 [Hydractinia symbiolongicarpus]|uniref:smoothelin-like protein 1 isoform X5 n=1 Tax=Hydractinia symbiolongicarpus TaxID=13093 RepID=UPI00254B7EAA|nr:smoothelin-like protein 1 isoform X5 [Hydractinia symbiolongicarpus]
MYQLPNIRNMVNRYDTILIKMTAVEELERKEKELKSMLELADSLEERKELRSQLREVRKKLFEGPTISTTKPAEKKINTNVEIENAKNSKLEINNNDTAKTGEKMASSMSIKISSNSRAFDTNNNSMPAKAGFTIGDDMSTNDINGSATATVQPKTRNALDRAERRSRRAAHMKALVKESSIDVAAGKATTVEVKNNEIKKTEAKTETKINSFQKASTDRSVVTEAKKNAAPFSVSRSQENKFGEKVTLSSRTSTPALNVQEGSPSGLRRTATWSTNRTTPSKNIGNTLNISKKFGSQSSSPSNDRSESPFASNRLSIGSNFQRSVSPRASPRSSPRASPSIQRRNEPARPAAEAPDLKKQSVADRMAFFRQAQDQEKKAIEKQKAQEEQRKRLSSAPTEEPKNEDKKEDEKPEKKEEKTEKKEEKEEPEVKDSEKMKYAAPCMKKREKKKVVRRTMSIGSIVLDWVQEMIRDYPVEVKNFSASWNDGMAFCALIHKFNPDAFDFSELKPENKRYNFDLAFNTGLKVKNIPILLDTEDMVMLAKPEPRSVQTYIQWIWSVYGPTSGYGPTPKEVQS